MKRFSKMTIYRNAILICLVILIYLTICLFKPAKKEKVIIDVNAQYRKNNTVDSNDESFIPQSEKYVKYEGLLEKYVKESKGNDYATYLDILEGYIEAPKKDPKDVYLLFRETRLHRALWDTIFGYEGPFTTETIKEAEEKAKQTMPKVYNMFIKLHKRLYKYAYGKKFNDLSELVKNHEGGGKGIIMCAGSKHFKYALSTIDSLRYIIKTDLPIQIFYTGETDIKPEEIKIFESYENVEVVNILDYFIPKRTKIIRWAAKPFAVLASKFDEVILIDADAIFLHDPIELFDEQGYKETGTFFFNDRTFRRLNKLKKLDSNEWYRSWNIDPLPETKQTRFWNSISFHEMESSLVIINKTRTLPGLLAIGSLNAAEIREPVIYMRIHGDKETFWMGYDMAAQHYHINNKTRVAYIGNKVYGTDQHGNKYLEKFCGHVAHTNSKGEIFYWNDHIVVDKSADPIELMTIDGYLFQREDEKGNNWIDNYKCYNMTEDVEILTLNQKEERLFQLTVDREWPLIQNPYGKKDDE